MEPIEIHVRLSPDDADYLLGLPRGLSWPR